MRQRLGLAAALLGDPEVLLLDEPTNGLDAEGIRWLRTFLRELAAEGRTVLVSSHLMAEVARTADHLLVIARGRLLADAPLHEVLDGHAEPRVRVRAAQGERLRGLLVAGGARVTVAADGVLSVAGVNSEEVSAVAQRHSVTLRELVPDQRSLEEAFLALTAEVDTSRDGRAA
jgi:ABC-2 type transport system ATP-binding protein